jgi:hypothetical protein
LNLGQHFVQAARTISFQELSEKSAGNVSGEPAQLQTSHLVRIVVEKWDVAEANVAYVGTVNHNQIAATGLGVQKLYQVILSCLAQLHVVGISLHFLFHESEDQ